MGLPNIEAPFMKAYPPERTEVFLDGHESAFAFFGVLSESPELPEAPVLNASRIER
jgi:hypothetical protein